VPRPFDGFTLEDYAQKMLDDYTAAGVPASDVYPQSFQPEVIRYWLKNGGEFAKQAVFLDETLDTAPRIKEMPEWRKAGLNYLSPAMPMLVKDEGGKLVPSDYAKAAKDNGFKLITWTLERSGPLARGGGWYFTGIENHAKKDGDTYKFAPGNENVIDAHIYQIKPDLPASMASILWLSNAPSRNTPYIPFYGTVTDTHPSFKPQDFTYNPDSFYWVAWHIDQMVMQNQNLFGSSIKQKWMALEKREEAEQRARDAKYRGKTDAQAAALSGEVTRDAIARSEKLFKEMKAVEKQMMQTIKAKGGKDDSIAVLQQKFDKKKADTVKTENASEGVTAK